jgi:putative phosphoesterase
MKIGVISDTHGYFDPQLSDRLAGVDVILHAGDVGSRGVLDDLGRIAPLRPVRGNVDPPESDLPLSLKLSFGQVQVEILHILPRSQSEVQEWSDASSERHGPAPRGRTLLKCFDDSTRVVIFGHSHQPHLSALGQVLFFNPGSAGKKRFSLPRSCGFLELTANRIVGWIELLEKYNGGVPCRIQIDLKG